MVRIIPQPKLIDRLPGEFRITPDTKIVAADGITRRLATTLNQMLFESCRVQLETTDEPQDANAIVLSLLDDRSVSDAEEYRLRVEWDRVSLTGSERGIFYGIQSLRSFLPPTCVGTTVIPAAEIYDSPRFRYRGMHLDVSRHFMPVESVKKFIHLLARYKFNYFHWHLTDDQGWRIEIKRYPLLTEIGSKRSETVIGKEYQPYRGDGKPVQGFYTQEEIADVVRYAAENYVTIVPEIEMPARTHPPHSQRIQASDAERTRYTR